jgi:hypothetical protein
MDGKMSIPKDKKLLFYAAFASDKPEIINNVDLRYATLAVVTDFYIAKRYNDNYVGLFLAENYRLYNKKGQFER